MSMTDGHLFFDADLFTKGRRPAANPFLSVTRVGRQTQTPLRRDIARHLLDLAGKYETALNFAKFGTDLSPQTQKHLELGACLWNMFVQAPSHTISTNVQPILAALLWGYSWDGHNSHLLSERYAQDANLRQTLDSLVSQASTLDQLVDQIKPHVPTLFDLLGFKPVAKLTGPALNQISSPSPATPTNQPTPYNS